MTRKILFYDSETSGLPNWGKPADDPCQPRIVQIAALLCDGDTGEVVTGLEMIVKPDGWTIGEEVAKIHGITNDMAMELGTPIAAVMDAYDVLLNDADLIACYNLKFDEKLIRGERRRLGRPDGFGEKRVFCVMRGLVPICKVPKKQGGGFKQVKLTEAVQMLLEREHVGAHGAMADTKATSDLYFKCKDMPEFIEAGSNFPSNKAE